jgi:hypothetical protein
MKPIDETVIFPPDAICSLVIEAHQAGLTHGAHSVAQIRERVRLFARFIARNNQRVRALLRATDEAEHWREN